MEVFTVAVAEMPFLSLAWSPLMSPATARDRHLPELAIGGVALLSQVAAMIRDNGDIDSGEGGIHRNHITYGSRSTGRPSPWYPRCEWPGKTSPIPDRYYKVFMLRFHKA